MAGSSKQVEPDDDARAVEAALAGRQAGYSALMRRHREPVFRMVRGHLGDEAAALDVTQESFIAAFQALRRYDPARAFRGWILRIALNKCRDWRRRRGVRRLFTFASPIEDAHAVADAAPDPETALASAHAVATIHVAITDLPDALKEPLLLCAMEGLTQDEAAGILGISRKAVETRLYRARQKLAHLAEG